MKYQKQCKACKTKFICYKNRDKSKSIDRCPCCQCLVKVSCQTYCSKFYIFFFNIPENIDYDNE